VSDERRSHLRWIEWLWQANSTAAREEARMEGGHPSVLRPGEGLRARRVGTGIHTGGAAVVAVMQRHIVPTGGLTHPVDLRGAEPEHSTSPGAWKSGIPPAQRDRDCPVFLATMVLAMAALAPITLLPGDGMKRSALCYTLPTSPTL
jgi:hypothetical protein